MGVFTRADDKINADREITGPLKTLLEVSMQSHYMYINNRADTQHQIERQRELLIDLIDFVIYKNKGGKFTHKMFTDAEKKLDESKEKVLGRLIKNYTDEVAEHIVKVAENEVKSTLKMPSGKYDDTEPLTLPLIEKLTDKQFEEIKIKVIKVIRDKAMYGTGLSRRFPCVTTKKVRSEDIETMVDCYLKDMKYDWQLAWIDDGKIFEGESEDKIKFQKKEAEKLLKEKKETHTRAIKSWTEALLDETEKEAKLFLENKGYSALKDLATPTSESTRRLAKNIKKRCCREKFIEYFADEDEEEIRRIIAEYAEATKNAMRVLPCFPQDALVTAENKGVIKIEDVRVGDRIATKKPNDVSVFEDVFMLGMFNLNSDICQKLCGRIFLCNINHHLELNTVLRMLFQ